MKKFSLLALALVVSACTIEGSDPAPGGGKTSAPAPSDTTKPGDPAKPGETPAETPKETPKETPAAGPTRVGVISLSAPTAASYTASASFAEVAAVTGDPPPNPCKTAKDGACTVSECDLSNVSTTPPPAGEVKKAPDAGDITIAGSKTITLKAAADTGAYKAAFESVALYAAGAEVSVKAAGATVPAFDKKITAPSAVNITGPTFPVAGYDLDRTKAIDLVWTGGNAGDLTASISSATADFKKTASVTCTYLAKDGKGTVPATALAKLIVGNGSFSVTTASTLAFDQGDWKLSVNASSTAKTALAKIK